VVQEVEKTFGKVKALDRVSLEVGDGEFVVLLGPSGCGKTTLLRVVAGLEETDRGRVIIAERDVTRLPPRQRGIAMVFQNYAVFPHMTVFENVAFGLRMQRVPEPEITRRVQRMAELVHIGELLDRFPAQLSGGQRQRVAMARALAVEPDVLLMDEPLSNLDALLRLEMRAELKKLLSELETTTIYVTHDQVEALSLADRIAVMEAGRIVQVGTPMQIYHEPANTFVGRFIGSPPMNFLLVRLTPPGPDGVRQAEDTGLAAPAGFASDEILLGIRPEDLEVVQTGPGTAAGGGESPETGPRLAGCRVSVVEPLGSHQLVTVEWKGQPLKVTAPVDMHLAPGDTVGLAPKTARVRWMDPVSGNAVGGAAGNAVA